MKCLHTGMVTITVSDRNGLPVGPQALPARHRHAGRCDCLAGWLSPAEEGFFSVLARQLSLLLPDVQEMPLQSPAGAHPAFHAAWQRAGERYLHSHHCEQSSWEGWKCLQLQRDESFDPTPVRLCFPLGQRGLLGGWRGGGLTLGRTGGTQ